MDLVKRFVFCGNHNIDVEDDRHFSSHKKDDRRLETDTGKTILIAKKIKLRFSYRICFNEHHATLYCDVLGLNPTMCNILCNPLVLVPILGVLYVRFLYVCKVTS